jgi:hypothetical protein
VCNIITNLANLPPMMPPVVKEGQVTVTIGNVGLLITINVGGGGNNDPSDGGLNEGTFFQEAMRH